MMLTLIIHKNKFYFYNKTQCVYFNIPRISTKQFSSLINHHNLFSKKVFIFNVLNFSKPLIKICFYSKAVIVVKQYSLINKIFRRFVRLLFIYILYVRSFFVKDRTYIFVTVFVPVITGIFISLSNIYPQNFSGFSAFYFFTFLGVQLIVYDELGSRISAYILNHPDPILSITMLVTLKNNNNVIARHFGFTTVTNLLLGKTAMTATGRASLVAGVFTGGAWLYNSARDRQATDDRSSADRQATADNYAKQRAYQNYQDAHKEYIMQPFYKQKGEKPCWDETNWSQWSKTK